MKVGLAAGAAVAALGIATTVPAQAAPATKSAPTYLLRLCLTLGTGSPLCIQL